MHIPSVLTLSKLLSDAPAGNPLARAALPAAAQAYGIDQDTSEYEAEPSGMTPPPIVSSGAPSGEAGSSNGVMNTGQYTNRHVLDSEEPEARPGFFKSDQFKNMANMGVGLLGGALGGAIAGDWKAGMAGGGMTQLKDFQAKQKDMLDRRHQAWESAYKEASALPVDIHTTPGMEEVAKAQQALMKDLQDGKVDNEQNLTNFLKVKAMYGKDIEDIQLNSKMADAKKVEDAKFQDAAQRGSQRAIALHQLVNDRMTPEPERQAAMAELATIEKDLEAQKDRDAQNVTANRHWDIQQSAQEARDRNSTNYNNAMLAGQGSRERIAAAQIQSREKLAQKAAFAGKVKALAAQSSRNNPELPEAAHFANAVKTLGGIQQISPGNVMILGEPVQLRTIFGDRPELWDANGEPSAKGWEVLYSVVGNDLELAGNQARQPQDLALSNLLPQQ